MKHKRNWIAAAMILLAVAAVAVWGHYHHHGPSDMASMTMPTNAVATNKVAIADFMFTPMTVRIKTGTTVTWTNTDNVNHTVTADKVSRYAPSSMDIDRGGTYRFTFTKAGTYTYHCFPHPYMHGTIVVTD